VSEDDAMMTHKEQLTADLDREEFMQELEGDKEMRVNVNLYKNDKLSSRMKKSNHMGEGMVSDDKSGVDKDEESDDEVIKLDELLDSLEINEDLLAGQILSAEEAANIPGLSIPSSGFDPVDIDVSSFKFK
jgi:hypothetical protein